VRAPAAPAGALLLKRCIDLAFAACALLCLSPLFLVVGILIKLTSRGPVFFRQRRLGKNGRPFDMLKFRTMIVNAEELKPLLASMNERTGPVFKMRNDPRVTKLGRVLRKFSIDELPQFVHVLTGEMSIVGPRPPIPAEVEEYQAWHFRRLSVPPGLTCAWQVAANRHALSFDEWVRLDLRYIDGWSPALDLKLIFMTIPVVFTGRGQS
jgi:lipopolysaccharide/colanic/teichoic acid biosynthesis glycosyltransferase